MTNLTTRTTSSGIGVTAKGSPLTNSELDLNFISLNDSKAEKNSSVTFTTVSATTGVITTVSSDLVRASSISIYNQLNVGSQQGGAIDPWNNQYAHLRLGAQGIFYGHRTTPAGLFISNNLYQDSGGTYRHINNGQGYVLGLGNNAEFFAATNGTASSAATLFSTITITEDGNLISYISSQSTTVTSGALVIPGGAGIGKNLNVGGDVDFTNNLRVGGNLSVHGNLAIYGSSTLVNAFNFALSDNMIFLNEGIVAAINYVTSDGTFVTYTTIEADIALSTGQTVKVSGITPSAYDLSSYVTIVSSNTTAFTFSVISAATGTYTTGGSATAKSGVTVDLGFTGEYNDNQNILHAGLFRDATDSVFKFFDNYVPEPDANINIDTAHSSFTLAALSVSSLLLQTTINNTATFSTTSFTLNYNANSSVNSLSGGSSSTIHLQAANTSSARLVLDAYGVGFASEIWGRRSQGSRGSEIAPDGGRALLTLNGTGWVTSNFVAQKANIAFVSAEAWNATSNGTYITFSTTTTGSTTLSERVRIGDNGNVSIGTSTTSTYKLQVAGSFAATTKSFLIDHPTRPGLQLQHGSLEGPENGVYVRGRLTNSLVINLPDYWTELVDASTMTVNLTALGSAQQLYVDRIENNRVYIAGAASPDCFYTIWAERKDVAKLQVEI